LHSIFYWQQIINWQQIKSVTAFEKRVKRHHIYNYRNGNMQSKPALQNMTTNRWKCENWSFIKN